MVACSPARGRAPGPPRAAGASRGRGWGRPGLGARAGAEAGRGGAPGLERGARVARAAAPDSEDAPEASLGGEGAPFPSVDDPLDSPLAGIAFRALGLAALAGVLAALVSLAQPVVDVMVATAPGKGAP